MKITKKTWAKFTRNPHAPVGFTKDTSQVENRKDKEEAEEEEEDEGKEDREEEGEKRCEKQDRKEEEIA